MTILGLQETFAKVKEYGNDKKMQEFLDDTKRATENRSWHPEDISILDGMKPADRMDVRDTIKAVTLEKLITEYMTASGTTGIGGAAYLIPDKIFDILYTAAKGYDIAPYASNVVSCPGSSLKVDIEVAGQYKPRFVAGGARMPDESMQIMQATATPKLFSINTAISNELIEDSQFALFETHLRRAAEEMGRFSTRMFLVDLILGADGDGTQNAVNGGSSTTTLGNLASAYLANLADGWRSDVAIVGAGALAGMLTDNTISAYSDSVHTKMTLTPMVSGDDPMLFGIDPLGMKVYVIPEQYTGTDGGLYLSSKWHSFVLNKANAMLTVRKRWLKIENYSDPVRDLVGAVISARQDEISIHNDASCEITEV